MSYVRQSQIGPPNRDESRYLEATTVPPRSVASFASFSRGTRSRNCIPSGLLIRHSDSLCLIAQLRICLRILPTSLGRQLEADGGQGCEDSNPSEAAAWDGIVCEPPGHGSDAYHCVTTTTLTHSRGLIYSSPQKQASGTAHTFQKASRRPAIHQVRDVQVGPLNPSRLRRIP